MIKVIIIKDIKDTHRVLSLIGSCEILAIVPYSEADKATIAGTNLIGEVDDILDDAESWHSDGLADIPGKYWHFPI